MPSGPVAFLALIFLSSFLTWAIVKLRQPRPLPHHTGRQNWLEERSAPPLHRRRNMKYERALLQLTTQQQLRH
ncbi:hypothetical protein SRHO_G00291630 [Serrasalmus rhombeus]